MFFGILLLQLILSVECVDIEEEIIHRVSKASNQINFKSCFEHLGCIDTNEVWYHDHIRPVNLEPLDRHTIRTEFIMIKNQSACRDKRDLVYDTVQVKADSIQNAGFKPESNTMLLIHDFTSNGYTGWIKHFAKVMEPSGTNIISVDWEGGAEPPFDQAIANARVVALEIINFYGVLNESFHAEPSKVHIVGHGIGAHIAGYVGRAIKGISRITALDPTGPRFEGMPEEVSLHKSHANYVEVLHTDSYNPRSQGTKAAIGHADFYINGAHLQPGCTDSATYPVFTKISRNDLKEGQILPACSHKRSFKYFIESVERNECVFTGIKCKSYEKFTAGGCASCTNKNGTHKCAAIGLGAANVTGKFFLNTRGEFPFCQHPYSINIHVSSQSPRLKGKFEMIFIDENNEVSNASVIDANQNVAEYVPGKTHTSLFYASSPKMTVIKEAKVKWIHKSNPWCVMFCHQFIIVNGISVKYISDASQDGESKLCPATKSKKIPNGEYLQFVKCDTITTEVPMETTTTSSHKTTKHHTDHHQKSTATTKKH